MPSNPRAQLGAPMPQPAARFWAQREPGFVPATDHAGQAIEARLTVIRASDGEVLGHLPTPQLIEATKDGTPADAWAFEGVWRLRDDVFDLAYFRPGVERVYTQVIVGMMPRRPSADVVVSRELPGGVGR